MYMFVIGYFQLHVMPLRVLVPLMAGAGGHPIPIFLFSTPFYNMTTFWTPHPLVASFFSSPRNMGLSAKIDGIPFLQAALGSHKIKKKEIFV